ncbi:hypothetical protein Y886_06135 [Xanthomonas hyacinthi DSM 19077]|nr:hypothetical protein Y886_06135 [Xanthomonas hyacinthi DSM 19077]
MFQILLALVVAQAGVFQPAVASSSPGDAIRETPGAPGRPVPGHTYKFVFDMNTSYDAALGFNPGLHALASLITEYASYGVDAGHRAIVVVLNGSHAEMALTDASYRRLHDGQGNPAIEDMQALEQLGVVFTVTARDVTSLAVRAADIRPGVKIGPRASIVYLDLESEGYVYSGLKSLMTE